MTAKPKARKRPATPTPIITQRLQLLAQATARLVKAERLVQRWRKQADWCIRQLASYSAPVDRATLKTAARRLRRCARELSRILKP